jgi:hypothetical protein
VYGTGNPDFDGNYARIQEIFFDDGSSSSTVIPAQITKLNNAADFRLNADCTLSTDLQSDVDRRFDVSPGALTNNKARGAYFDTPETRQQLGFITPTCGIDENDILSCSVGSLSSFILCVCYSCNVKWRQCIINSNLPRLAVQHR